MQEYSPRPRSDFPTNDPPVAAGGIEFLEPITKAPPQPTGPIVVQTEGAYVWKTLWLMVPVICLLLAIFFGPWIVERYHYAAARGEQMARHEVAAAALQDSPLQGLSVYYQMVTEEVGPSVVHINTRMTPVASEEQADDPFRFFHHYESRGQGSGVIVDGDGYVITNYHVIKDSTDIRVTLSTDETVAGKLIGYDEPTDIAVLKIEAAGLQAAEWGDSDQVKVGSLVWAIGSPFGLQQSVTCGILSAKHRNTGHPYQDFLQTDAAVNPGNSGGPLVDERGKIVGINTAIVGQTYQGICFAIPSNVARHVYGQIKGKGRVARGWLGIRMEPITPERADELGLVATKGAVVTDTPDLPELPSPARQAGIRAGDVVVRWNGQDIDNPTTLFRTVALTSVGSEVNVTVIRDGQPVELTVAIGERPHGIR